MQEKRLFEGGWHDRCFLCQNCESSASGLRCASAFIDSIISSELLKILRLKRVSSVVRRIYFLLVDHQDHRLPPRVQLHHLLFRHASTFAIIKSPISKIRLNKIKTKQQEDDKQVLMFWQAHSPRFCWCWWNRRAWQFFSWCLNLRIIPLSRTKSRSLCKKGRIGRSFKVG